jgi:hypothetical protein
MKLSLLLVALFWIFNCQSVMPVENMDPDYGDIEGNIYESSKGKFVCYVPVDARYAVMNDGKYKVSFHQKDLGLFKIQAIKLNPEFQQNLTKLGKEKALESFIDVNLIQKLSKNRPDTKILASEFYKEFRNGLYYFIVNIPNAANQKENTEGAYNSYAMMAFVSGNFIYLVTRDAVKSDDLLVQVELSRQRLIDFHSRILILGDHKVADLDIDAFDPEEEGEDAEEEEEEEGGGGGGGGVGGEIDLGGLLKVLQKRLYTPKGKFDIKPGRFKFNTKQFNSNRFKMSGRTNIQPGRFKMKSSFKTPRFKR